MKLQGTQLIGQRRRADSSRPFRGQNARAGEPLEPAYREASEQTLDEAMTLAEEAFRKYRRAEPEEKARFLRRIAEELAESILLGVGQYCTNPGLIFGRDEAALEAFEAELSGRIQSAESESMLYPGICKGFSEGVRRLRDTTGVEVVAESTSDPDPQRNEGRPVVFRTDASTFSAAAPLRDEVFGPSSLVVRTASDEQLLRLARGLEGQLTATLRATEEELQRYDTLVRVLQRRAGRLIFNGVPTGVAVCHAMQHGGPYPATTDARSTSVGTAAIKRFARPVAYQDFPTPVLPEALRDRNERSIWRLVDGEPTREDL